MTITARAAGQFAAALGERDPELLDGRRLAPTMAIVPAWESQELALERAFGAEAMAHGLHAEHAFEFIRDLRPRCRLHARSRVAQVQSKAKGTLITVLTEVLDDQGVVNRQRYLVFAVGLHDVEEVTAADGLPARRPAEAASKRVVNVTDHVAEDQAVRYAEASGDRFALHLSDDYARSLGFAGTILHGMCTFGYAARALRDVAIGSADGRLACLGVRFSAPVLIPNELCTEVTMHAPGPNEVTGTFATRDSRSSVEVLSRGFFAVSRQP